MLDIVASYHCMQIHGILMNQTWENGKKTSFGSDFGPFGPKLGPKSYFSWILPLLHVRHSCKLSLYAISRKTNESKLRKFCPIFEHLAQIWDTNFFLFFFFKNWLSVTRYCIMVSYHVKYQKKTNDPIFGKLSDGQTDRRTERQRDGREWFHRMLSD